jgi:DNA primase
MTPEEIRARTNLCDLIERSGVSIHMGTTAASAICPFHSDNRASLKIWPNQQRWYCFACGTGGDVFNWIMTRDTCTFKQAIQTLEKGDLGPAIILKKQNTPKKIASPVPHIVVEEFHQELQKYPDVTRYITSVRKWTQDVIDTYYIGYDSERHKITIPIPDPLGTQWIDVRMYRPNPPLGEQKMMPFSVGRYASFYDLNGVNNDRYCLLVEGEPDALAAASAGIPVATNTNGTNASYLVWSTWAGLVTAPRVLICYDRDEPGKLGAERILPLFSNATIVTLPEIIGEKGDITDLIRMWGHEKTREFIECHL